MGYDYFVGIWSQGWLHDFTHSMNETEKKIYLHKTLVRPFELLTDEKFLEETVVNCCRELMRDKTRLPEFTVGGVGYFLNKNAIIYLKVSDDGALLSLSDSIEKGLSDKVNFVPLLSDNKTLHYTLEEVPRELLQERLKRYDWFNEWKLTYDVQRIAVIKLKEILFEYDFLQNRVLRGEEVKDRNMVGISELRYLLDLAKEPET